MRDEQGLRRCVGRCSRRWRRRCHQGRVGRGICDHARRKLCVRLGELCGADPSKETRQSCVEDMQKMRKMSGDAAFERSQSCVAESKSCGAASGCMMGGVGVGTLGEVLKGFGTALFEDKQRLVALTVRSRRRRAQQYGCRHSAADCRCVASHACSCMDGRWTTAAMA